jgi:peptidoglycan hydrolase CwlO-like protein
MMAKNLGIAAALTAIGLALAAPGAVAKTPIKADIVRDDINRLDADIDQADNNDTISEREAAKLHKRVKELRNDFQRLNRNGLSRDELTRLEQRINQIRTSLRLERIDYDHHAG